MGSLGGSMHTELEHLTESRTIGRWCLNPILVFSLNQVEENNHWVCGIRTSAEVKMKHFPVSGLFTLHELPDSARKLWQL